jgi:hypothetical protein
MSRSNLLIPKCSTAYTTMASKIESAKRAPPAVGSATMPLKGA